MTPPKEPSTAEDKGTQASADTPMVSIEVDEQATPTITSVKLAEPETSENRDEDGGGVSRKTTREPAPIVVGTPWYRDNARRNTRRSQGAQHASVYQNRPAPNSNRSSAIRQPLQPPAEVTRSTMGFGVTVSELPPVMYNQPVPQAPYGIPPPACSYPSRCPPIMQPSVFPGPGHAPAPFSASPWGNQPVHPSTAGMAHSASAGFAGYWNPNSGKGMEAHQKPDTTPQGHHRDFFSQPTSGPGLIYNQTEPRNFAPRTSDAYLPPPPAFNLDVHHGREHGLFVQQGVYDPDDPFMVPTPAVPSTLVSMSLAMSNNCSDQLRELTHKKPFYMPTPAEIIAKKNLAFIESAIQSHAEPKPWGVVRVSNIPFATKRSEIIAFLGKNSKILNDNDEPVHIIMERTTSKTGDAYVEFLTKEAAERAVHRHNEATQRGRQPRIGNRPADLAVVNQEHLMQQLFPTAKAVNWSATRATIKEPVEGQPWTIFKGFVSEEELTLLIKHVEQPSRSPYAKDCPQRPYECMISTIRKYPWYMSEHITIKQRQMVFNTTLRLTEILRRVIDRGVTRGDERGRVNRAGEVVLNEQLFKRLVYTALACTGFSAYQKNEIARVAGWSNEKVVHGFNQPPNAGAWVHLHTSAPRPGMPLDLLGWYIAVIRERTTDMVRRLPNQERMEMEQLGTKTDMTFGYLFWVMKIPKVEQLELMTLKQVYNMEYNAIKTVLEGAAADAHANRLRYALPTAETDEDSET